MFRRFYFAPIPQLILRNPSADAYHIWKKVRRFDGVLPISKIQLVVYYQCCVLIDWLIGWATTRLYVIAH